MAFEGGRTSELVGFKSTITSYKNKKLKIYIYGLRVLSNGCLSLLKCYMLPPHHLESVGGGYTLRGGAETQRVSTPQTNGGVRWASQRDNRAYTNKQG